MRIFTIIELKRISVTHFKFYLTDRKNTIVCTIVVYFSLLGGGRSTYKNLVFYNCFSLLQLFKTPILIFVELVAPLHVNSENAFTFQQLGFLARNFKCSEFFFKRAVMCVLKC